MNDEFSQLEERDYQKKFLKDWWSEKKLFRGSRYVGKSTLMLCEARRFSECGFSVLFLSPIGSMSQHLKSEYQKLFGEMPTFKFGNYNALNRGRMRGMMQDVIILDEAQETTLQKYNEELAPMDPKFVRASCSTASQNWLSNQDEGAFFDSIYTEV